MAHGEREAHYDWERWLPLDIYIRCGVTVQTIFFTIDVKVEILEIPEVNRAHWQAQEIDWWASAGSPSFCAVLEHTSHPYG